MAENNSSHATGELARKAELNKIHPAAMLFYKLLNSESFRYLFKELSYFGQPVLIISLYTLWVLAYCLIQNHSEGPSLLAMLLPSMLQCLYMEEVCLIV
jgi:hypothetical protein